jgi:phage baseplate assembly protein gpV
VTLTLFESIQQIVQDELQSVRTAELAVVQEQHPSDPDNYACTVVLRDSGIVLRNVPVATSRIGAVAIPAVGELVLVQFVGGDINAPVIVGRLYNERDRPPENEDGRAVLHLPLGASDDSAVHIELKSGKARELSVKLGSAVTFVLRDDDPVVEIDAGGQAKVTIERDGTVAVKSSGKLELKASEIKVEAEGKLTLKGATVNIN